MQKVVIGEEGERLRLAHGVQKLARINNVVFGQPFGNFLGAEAFGNRNQRLGFERLLQCIGNFWDCHCLRQHKIAGLDTPFEPTDAQVQVEEIRILDKAFGGQTRGDIARRLTQVNDKRTLARIFPGRHRQLGLACAQSEREYALLNIVWR